MKQHRHKSDIILTAELFEKATAALDRQLHDVNGLTWSTFRDHTRWVLEPTGNQYEGFAAFFTVRQTADRLVGLSYRLNAGTFGKRRLPYNRPYRSTTETILSGGFTEQRYIRHDKGIGFDTITYRPGDHFYQGHDTFCDITWVAPRTLSLIVCSGPVHGGQWFLDPTTNKLVSFKDNLFPGYDHKFAVINQRF